nr:MAG TPA: PHD - plant homeodomain finger protein [Caudoviricetes sp.]
MAAISALEREREPFFCRGCCCCFVSPIWGL